MMTEQEFDNIPDDNLWSAVYDSIYAELPSDRAQGILQASLPQQAVVLISRLGSEVCNGGFDQYYFNNNDVYAVGENEPMLPTVLELIGADNLADICRRANRVLNENLDKVIDSFSKANSEKIDNCWCDLSWETHLFDSFDEEWYACDERENLKELMIPFIRKHKSDFCVMRIEKNLLIRPNRWTIKGYQ